jgi:signal transduction histidine kinase
MNLTQALNKDRLIILWCFIFGLIIIAFVFSLRVQTRNIRDLPAAEKAVFDFSKIDFQQQSFIKLKGRVALYWNSLLTPADLGTEPLPEPTGYIEIPGAWNGFETGNGKITARGYGTYRFRILVPEEGMYGLKIKEFETAYALWINGEPLGGSGIVSDTKKGMKPCWRRHEFYTLSQNKEIDVVLQISNFYHRNGGATEIMVFGAAGQIMKLKSRQISLEVFVFGVLFILFLYHMLLYFYRKSDKSILWFTLVCLFVFLRLGTTGEKVLLELWPSLPWAVAIRIEYISFMALAPSMLWFMRELFPQEISLRFSRLVTAVSAVFVAIVLFTPASIFSYTPLAFQVIIILLATYLLVLLFIAILRGREFAVAIFGGFLLFYLFTINDFLYYDKALDTAYLMPFAIFILLISQAFVLAKRTSTAFAHVELLSRKLEQSNAELEDRVALRTKQISNQKEEIEEQKANLEKKAAELSKVNEKMKELADFKREMTNMMIHDMKNPLSNIIGFSEIDTTYSKYRELIHSSGWEIQNMIRNILDVEKYDKIHLNLNLEDILLNELVDRAYQTVEFLVYKTQISYENLIPADLIVRVDSEIIERVFANILSNATKYGKQKGLIRLSAELVHKETGKFSKVTIYNSGETVPADKIEAIFEKYTQLYAQKGVYTYSTGLGLTYCRMAVEAHGGKIGAISDEREGIHFWFTLPVPVQ